MPALLWSQYICICNTNLGVGFKILVQALALEVLGSKFCQGTAGCPSHKKLYVS